MRVRFFEQEFSRTAKRWLNSVSNLLKLQRLVVELQTALSCWALPFQSCRCLAVAGVDWSCVAPIASTLRTLSCGFTANSDLAML
jgi:hypothetical protein